nr:MAG TPA: hypothetical protein [Caudoviricetes sp.]
MKNMSFAIKKTRRFRIILRSNGILNQNAGFYFYYFKGIDFFL